MFKQVSKVSSAYPAMCGVKPLLLYDDSKIVKCYYINIIIL